MELVYILDDEDNILEIVMHNLEKNGYATKGFKTSADFFDAFYSRKPDLVILDLMLPDRDGFEICKEIKSKTNVPVIILSARGEEFDKVLGLELGADDYIVKPFGIRELIARVKNVLRRSQEIYEKSDYGKSSKEFIKKDFYFGNTRVFVDEEKHEFWLDDDLVKLNPKEFMVISILLRNLDKLTPRSELIRMVWGEDYFGDTRTLDVHIRRLRKKLSHNNFGKSFIKTVHGYGYKLISEGKG
ncbi:MAG: response regulator transcription factor [Actinobacteria bacterium]|nr:response regulator transcription factor [Actinomycetota bacterium]